MISLRNIGWMKVLMLTGVICAALALVRSQQRAVGEESTPVNVSSSSIDFVKDIQPIFEHRCYQCHDGAKHKGGLRLDSKSTAFIGGDSGDPSLVPNQPDHSKIIQLVRGDDPNSVMPPKGERLTSAEIDLLSRWVKHGAIWPDGIDKPAAALSHWSFAKPIRPAIPKTHLQGWVKNAIDSFVLAKLESAGLAPMPEADKYTLCRRLYLDLIGLPPSPRELEAFVNDSDANAYEHLVDRLLANPHYGERWARPWLDCARYADSAGYGSDPLRKTCFRYRDWVIQAFNQNLPYDEFTVKQIAGDLLPHPTTDDLIATSFNRNTMTNTEGGTDREEFRTAAVKDRVETSVQVWMGLTMGCAQCHTHKYDPITNREYYQLFAIFNQTEDADRPDEAPTIPTPTPEQESRMVQLKSQIDAEEKKFGGPEQWGDAMSAWEKSLLDHPAEWTPIEPATLSTSSGAKLIRQPDGSILASGPVANRDDYLITAHVDLSAITAFRLDVLPDEHQPHHGVGRHESGNFVLTHFEVKAGPEHSPPLPARFVRIELPGHNKILSLAEVQIFEGNENVALKGKAKQSTTDFDGKAGFAIDGITDGDFTSHPTSHTRESENPWWEVDLGSSHDLSQMAIWNRTDSRLYERLNHFRVLVLDEKHQPVWETEILSPPNPFIKLDLTAPREILFAGASDTYHQTTPKDSPAARAVNNAVTSPSGWGVFPQVDRSHSAIFPAAKPISGPVDLAITLMQNYPDAPIGRFRLWATSSNGPIQAIPEAISEALAVVPEHRSAEQKSRLFEEFKATSAQGKTERERIASLKKELDEIKPLTTAVMRELPPDKRRENHVLIKGNFLNKGPAVTPTVLAAFNPLPKSAKPDRLGLAEWFIDENNPLTARVEVNRIWATIFGTGIVETQEDFGTQGQPPSNQELLDYLAVEFRDPQRVSEDQKSWDMKRMVKMIVMSAAYRQSSRVTAEALAKDPKNRLISRGPRRRLEAELVRDQALALSGLLSDKMFGPSVFPPQPDGLWQAAFNGERTYPTSMGEDRYRRGIYVFWRRTIPYPSMSAFDAPSREVCTLRRVMTSTPLQAFVTMNDPVYVECSQALARRIVKEGGKETESRAAYALQLCLGRPPEPQQTTRLISLYQEQLEHYRGDKDAAKKMAADSSGKLPEGMAEDELAAWTVCANVMLNLDGVLTNH